MAVGITEAGRRHCVSYGKQSAGDRHPVNELTLFEIGSVTKLFTSLLLADMVIRRKAERDEPVAKLLPSSVRVPERNGRQITLVDLAKHLSGLPRLPANLTPNDPADPYAHYTAQHLYEWQGGVVVLGNSAAAVGDLGSHLRDTRWGMLWYRHEAKMDPACFARFVGCYRLKPQIIMEVTASDGHLFVRLTGQASLRVFPASEWHFFYKAVGAQITFELGEDGRAARLILHQNSIDRIAERMADSADASDGL